MRTLGKLLWILVIFCSANVSVFLPRWLLKIALNKRSENNLSNDGASFVAHKNCITYKRKENHVVTDILKSKDDNKRLSYNETYNELEKYLIGSYVEDPKLLRFLRKYWLVPPTKRVYGGEEAKDRYYGQAGQAGVVDQILKGKTNGVYVESGAADGISSNTIFFEKFRNWTGVLVEPIPGMYNKLIGWRRQAWHLNSCLSSNNKMEKIKFANFGTFSGNLDSLNKLNGNRMKEYDIGTITVQCFPFHSVAAALNFTFIDYFSLDVEGAEMQVLKTIDFTKISVRVFSIEYRDGINTLSKLRDLRDFFTKLGYKEWGLVSEKKWMTGQPKDNEGLDVIFYKR
ncbi:unnamed protein product [Owenia fusiformis]|uniref:Uncharacterized protein n=1 Tax=Owenia fusiformis TaxID=6347 RepID=A0A8J1Y5X4_OWEFU|nr:unnamed protein product [Owenia fusiformis]